MRDELSKQKEYFEKKRYQNKVKRFEKPVSPRKRKLQLSTDLLSLQAATFSAKKFSTADSSSPTIQKKVTRVDLDQSKSSLLPFHRLDDVELPMSPGAPSKLLLQEACTSMEKEPVSIIKRTEEDTSHILMTHKDRIKEDQDWMLSNIPSLDRQSLIPHGQYTEETTCQENTRIPSRALHNESPAALANVSHIQEHYQVHDRTWTTDPATSVMHEVVHERAPEKLFFEFLPQAMSTVKRPLLEESDSTVHLASPLSDISYADSLPSTIRDEVDSESLVPQINHSSPTTTSSSPWEAGNLTTSLDMSSDNTEPFSTKPTFKGHGHWSSTAEDTPHLSDSSLTTFRQYHRKKLKGLSKSSIDQHYMTSSYLHDSGTAVPSAQQNQGDHLNHGTYTVSSFQHTSKDLPSGSMGVTNVTEDEENSVHLIDSMEYADDNRAYDVKIPFNQPCTSFSQSKQQPVLFKDDLSAPVKNIAKTTRDVILNEQVANGVVKTNALITEWTDFIGGLDEEGTDGNRTGVDDSFSAESSQRSCEDDRMNVTNQVLMEVMALDKKMNEAGNTPGLSGIMDKIPDDCLEVFTQQTDIADPSHNNVTEEDQSTMGSSPLVSGENYMKNVLSKSMKAESNKLEDGSKINNDSETSKELPEISTVYMENIAGRNSDQDISNKRLKSAPQNGKDPLTNDTVKKACSADDNDYTYNGNSQSDKKMKLVVETCTSKPDVRHTNGNDLTSIIFPNKEGNEVATCVSPAGYQNRITQCQILTAAGTGLSSRSDADVQRHVGIQTDEQNVDPLHKKDVRDNEVQCELNHLTTFGTHNRQASTIAGGRVNGREDKAYGPNESSDLCLVS